MWGQCLSGVGPWLLPGIVKGRACSMQYGSRETSQPHLLHSGMSTFQSRCHGNPSAGFSSAALLCASGFLSPLCHSCPHAPPSMTGFRSQPPVEPAGIQTAFSWVQTPCSMHMGTCTAGCIDTAIERRERICVHDCNLHGSDGFYSSYPTMQISLALWVWAWKKWGQGK